MSSLTIVQHVSAAGTGFGTPGSGTLTSTPTVGNLIVAFLGVNIGASSLTINTPDWSIFKIAYSTAEETSIVLVGLYRYVQSGDTTTMPAFVASGSTYWAYSAYEIAGVSGTWASDALCWNGIGSQSSLSSQTCPPNYAALSDSLMLIGFSQYDGSTVPSFSAGSYTLDEAGTNNSTYGSYGCGSLALGATTGVTGGATVDWTNTSGPLGLIQLVLTPSVPTYPIMRQTVAHVNFAGTVSGLNLGADPTPGNLVVAIVHWVDGSAVLPTISSDWTLAAQVLNGSDTVAFAVYRYAQSGDTAALPAIETGASRYWAAELFEIANVGGTFGSDCTSVHGDFSSSANTLTTTADTTSVSNALVIIGAAEYNGNHNPTTSSSGWTVLEAANNSINFGSCGSLFQYYPTSGSNASAAINYTDTSVVSYIQMLFQPGFVGTETSVMIFIIQ